MSFLLHEWPLKEENEMEREREGGKKNDKVTENMEKENSKRGQTVKSILSTHLHDQTNIPSPVTK